MKVIGGMTLFLISSLILTTASFIFPTDNVSTPFLTGLAYAQSQNSSGGTDLGPGTNSTDLGVTPQNNSTDLGATPSINSSDLGPSPPDYPNSTESAQSPTMTQNSTSNATTPEFGSLAEMIVVISIIGVIVISMRSRFIQKV